MKYRFLSEADFDEVLNTKSGLVLVVFEADWSASCHMIAPYLVSLPKILKDDITIFKLNYDENKKIVMGYGIQEVPTTLFFKAGGLIDRIEGLVSKRELIARVRSHL